LKNKPDVTVQARMTVDLVWKNSDLKGRCWGPRGAKRVSPYAGTNITLAIGDELVTISENKKTGALIVHEFKKMPWTKLGRQIRQLLKGHRLPLQA
jgi:hypothetical protein